LFRDIEEIQDEASIFHQNIDYAIIGEIGWMPSLGRIIRECGEQGAVHPGCSNDTAVMPDFATKVVSKIEYNCRGYTAPGANKIRGLSPNEMRGTLLSITQRQTRLRQRAVNRYAGVTGRGLLLELSILCDREESCGVVMQAFVLTSDMMEISSRRVGNAGNGSGSFWSTICLSTRDTSDVPLGAGQCMWSRPQ
jgi:hypothetical protein